MTPQLFALNIIIVVNNNYLRTVAEIGMVRSIFMTTEADTSISLCAVLTNFVELDIPLTAFVQTQAITAAG
jgi:hypothetical protein